MLVGVVSWLLSMYALACTGLPCAGHVRAVPAVPAEPARGGGLGGGLGGGGLGGGGDGGGGLGGGDGGGGLGGGGDGGGGLGGGDGGGGDGGGGLGGLSAGKQALEVDASDAETLLYSRKSPEAATAAHDCNRALPSRHKPPSVRSEKTVSAAAVGTLTNSCMLLDWQALPVAAPLLLAVKQKLLLVCSVTSELAGHDSHPTRASRRRSATLRSTALARAHAPAGAGVIRGVAPRER